MPCARPAGGGCPGSRSHLLAFAAVAPQPGPSSAVASAPGAACPFLAQGRHLRMTTRCGLSSPAGRNEGCAESRAWLRSSSSKRCRPRRRMPSSSSLLTPAAGCSGVTTRPRGLRIGSADAGNCRSCLWSSELRRAGGSAASPWPSDGRMSPACSAPAVEHHLGSCSWTTSTRVAQPLPRSGRSCAARAPEGWRW